MMLTALLSGLLELEDVELTVSMDPRLPHLSLPLHVVYPDKDADIWTFWQRCIDMSDAFWPIAPESGCVLEKLSRMAEGKQLLGSQPDAVRIAASKFATAQHLFEHSIDIVPTWRFDDFHGKPGSYVVKPDDGAGSEDTLLFHTAREAKAWLRDRQSTHVIQPWLEGEPASISMLCSAGRAQLLSSNRQMIELSGNEIHYRGSVVNGMLAYRDALDNVAARIAQSMPGLAGYVGVDVMMNDGVVTVLEINPRLTTSSVGIQAATGMNLAGMVVDLLYNQRMVDPDALQSNMIEVTAHG